MAEKTISEWIQEADERLLRIIEAHSNFIKKHLDGSNTATMVAPTGGEAVSTLVLVKRIHDRITKIEELMQRIHAEV